MKFQTLVLLGLFALTTTVTAQSASAQVPNQTHLTASDVATLGAKRNSEGTAKSRKPEARPPAPSTTQILNLTHLTSDKVSVLQVDRVAQTVQPWASSFTPGQMSSDDTASIGVNSRYPQDSVDHSSQRVQPAVGSSPTPAQMSSDDTASVGIITRNSQGSTTNPIAAQPQYPPSPIVDVVVDRNGLRPVINSTQPTISEIE